MASALENLVSKIEELSMNQRNLLLEFKDYLNAIRESNFLELSKITPSILNSDADVVNSPNNQQEQEPDSVQEVDAEAVAPHSDVNPSSILNSDADVVNSPNNQQEQEPDPVQKVDAEAVAPHSDVNPVQKGYHIHYTHQRKQQGYSMMPRAQCYTHHPLVQATTATNHFLNCINIDKVIAGKDQRTTLVIMNIPNRYTLKMLFDEIEEFHKVTYDFLYIPVDLKNKNNLGFAYINMLSPKLTIPFHPAFSARKWDKCSDSGKVSSLIYSYVQGKVELMKQFKDSMLINEDPRSWPIVFRSQVPQQEHFPSKRFIICTRRRDGSCLSDMLHCLDDDSDKSLGNK